MLEFNTNEFEDTRQVDALKVIWMYTFPLKTLFIPQIEITGLSSKPVYGEAFPKSDAKLGCCSSG